MITDRTFEDTTRAKKIRAEKINKQIPLTDEEETAMERGALTIQGINRIEQKQTYLKNIINEMGYYGFDIINEAWDGNGVFKHEDLSRLCKNTAELRKAFFVLSSTPPNPYAEYDYRQLNRLEQVLVDIESQIEFIKGNYMECGTFESGGNA